MGRSESELGANVSKGGQVSARASKKPDTSFEDKIHNQKRCSKKACDTPEASQAAGDGSEAEKVAAAEKMNPGESAENPMTSAHVKAGQAIADLDW
ncbi:uncharacterized protein AtWU_02350 [Aspergillus tubingensis]|uniref:uncharacterized protein n=1 Tax=Aspergillus tubingensis TaxID=5068 RepID=UPI001578B235|nr:uncharacterized protein AtWU_02350 [Aspergillus tubingensis]GFN12553.1 hypothetical protein AtWU_02350 [Aspergillus tubingensis]